MAEYTSEYEKRTIIKDGVLYMCTDEHGRVRIPRSLIAPKYRQKKCTVYLKDDKVIFEYNDDSPVNNSGDRITIPSAIRGIIKLKRDDFLKVTRNKDGTVFTLSIANDELTEEDLERFRNG